VNVFTQKVKGQGLKVGIVAALGGQYVRTGPA